MIAPRGDQGANGRRDPTESIVEAMPCERPPIAEPTSQRDPISSERTASVSKARMVATIATRLPYLPRTSSALASVRLAQVYAVARARTALDLYRRSVERVCRGNEVFLAFGMPEFVLEQMAVIEASLGGSRRIPLHEALHEAELADAAEQVPDETFRYRLSQGTATVEEAKDWLRKTAAQCVKAEVAMREVQDWIRAKEAE